jgi:cytochrome c oxidase cbb3-type subunit 3
MVFLKTHKLRKAMKHNILQRAITALLLIATTVTASAQDTAPSADPNFYTNFLTNGLLLFAGLAVLGTLLAIFQLLNISIRMQQIRMYQEQGIEVSQEAAAPETDLWQRLYKRWTNVVPVEREEEILFDHNYDGIRELDNSLPPWWVAMFFVTIAFGGVYMLYYHVTGLGMGSASAYEAEMKKAEVAIAAFQARQADRVDEANLVPLTSDGDLAAGQTLYKTNCVACHGALGEGGVGPNMTDPYWLHGGSIKNIYLTIKNGVPEKGMIAWKNQFRPADLHRLASYILTLQGTTPPNGKAPEGTLYQGEMQDSPTPAQDSSGAANGQIGMLNQ